tara:strand:+ start:2299 stop:2592 length:294 start_codon:yes stop_codon:yes gene_type:complete
MYRGDSHLAHTKINAKFTELYEPGNELFSTEQVEHTIESKHNKRPDLLAYELYGNQRLWWIFMHFNPNIIKDPIMDFNSGKTILVPLRRASSSDARM